MKILPHEARTKLSEDDHQAAQRRQGSRASYTRTQGQYRQILNHPDRMVAVSTVYKWLKENPRLTIDQACKRRPNSVNTPKVGPTKAFDGNRSRYGCYPWHKHRNDPEYVADLLSGKKLADIAAKWGGSVGTVRRHKAHHRKLRKQRRENGYE